MRFETQHVVVTGAARGIGRAVAERLASEGARLTLLDRDAAGVEEVATRLDADAAIADIRNADTVRRAAPDGYTLLFHASLFVLGTYVVASCPSDPQADFRPIAQAGDAPPAPPVRST